MYTYVYIFCCYHFAQAPVWIQDCRATMCQSCATEFTVTYRRHHCRACGKVSVTNDW